MRLEDALYNWLQIKIVVDARDDDHAAHETLQFFDTILQEDHKLESYTVTEADEFTYAVNYVQGGQNFTLKFDREAASKLLEDINSNPKYNEA